MSDQAAERGETGDPMLAKGGVMDEAPKADPTLAAELWEAYHRGWRDKLAERSAEVGLGWEQVMRLARESED